MIHRVVAVFVCLLLLPPPAFPWGNRGHRIVALIAAKNLSTTAQNKVAAILGTNVNGLAGAMAAAATWPDEIRKDDTKTGAWHYVDAPVTASFLAFCPRQECVIDRIQEMANRLMANQKGFKLAKAPNPPRPMTSQELAFLIHFLGDIHQPLHAANNGDRGGNCVGLTTPLPHSDQSQTKDLHAAWDVDEVLAVLKILGTENAAATALFQKSRTEPVQQLTVLDWARESNGLARQHVYQKLQIPPHTAPPGQCAAGIANVKVTQQYLDGNEPVVERQLLRAGIRLSNLLNQICTAAGCKAKP